MQNGPLVVGSISDLETLRELNSDDTPQFDVLEVRLDGIEKGQIDDAHWLCLRVKSWGVPILITMRDSSEGGIMEWTVAEKRARLCKFAEVAHYADIEIACFSELSETVRELRGEGIRIILSHHNFIQTPPSLEQHYREALGFGADIVKFALMHQTTSDLQVCADFLQQVDSPVALMGMGKFAPVSRLLYAQLGSVLNYGFLGKTPTAPGQWSAAFLKQGIDQLEL